MNNSQIRAALVQRFRSYLNRNRQRYKHHTEPDGTVLLRYTKLLPCQVHQVDIMILIRHSAYHLYGILPFTVPTADPVRTGRLLELLNHINHDLTNGCVEMNPESGCLHCRIYGDCEGGALPTDGVIHNGLLTIDYILIKFGSALTQVLFGDTQRPVAELVKQCRHHFRIALLEQALRSAADAHTPLEEFAENLAALTDEVPSPEADGSAPPVDRDIASGE